MKIVKSLFIFFFLISYLSISAQYKHFKKIEKFYQAKDYNKCIEVADKISDKNRSEPEPYFYISLCYYEQYKQENDSTQKARHLRNSLRYLEKGQKKDDKDSSCTKNFDELYQTLHKITVEYGNKLYKKADIENATTYYEYIADIYGDTTNQYKKILNPPENVGKNQQTSTQKATPGPNKIDATGKKQGVWRKIYPNGNLAYEIYFKNDKPLGEYIRYHENGKINAKLYYRTPGGFATAELYNDDGDLVAKGFYNGQQKDSTWKYYSTNKQLALAQAELKKWKINPNAKMQFLMCEENYKNGKLNGEVKFYYPSGAVYEIRHYENDVENGIAIEYFDNGNKKSEVKIENGKRTGIYIVYFNDGKINITGAYKNDLRNGKWTYYDGQKQVVKEEEYSNGKLLNEGEIEGMTKEEFDKYYNNAGKITDPSNFKGNPMQYYMEKQKNNPQNR